MTTLKVWLEVPPVYPSRDGGYHTLTSDGESNQDVTCASGANHHTL